MNRGHEDPESLADPGLAGVAPFTWSCTRSGRCCRVPHGVVWVEEQELESMARATNCTVEVFAQRYLRKIPDPRQGHLRLALIDGPIPDCVFLDDGRHCRIYQERPSHCRNFPYWESILNDEEGLRRAEQVCPGIQRSRTRR